MTSRTKKPKLIVLCVLIVAVAGIAIFMNYAHPKSSTSVPIDTMGMMHLHTHLTLVIDGKEEQVPANIGIDPSLWNDHSLDSYGMKGMTVLHTHDTSGTIHVESYKVQDYTFGQLLDIWKPDLVGDKIFMTVNGQPVQDYQNYIFKDGDKVILSVSTK